MPKGSLRIDMLGTSFVIKADEDETYLCKVLQSWQKIVEETKTNTGLSDPLKIAIVAGMLVSDELLKAKSQASHPEELETERIALDLIARIDETLID